MDIQFGGVYKFRPFWCLSTKFKNVYHGTLSGPEKSKVRSLYATGHDRVALNKGRVSTGQLSRKYFSDRYL